MKDKQLNEISAKLDDLMREIKSEISSQDDPELKKKLVRMTDYVVHLKTKSLPKIDGMIIDHLELKEELVN